MHDDPDATSDDLAAAVRAHRNAVLLGARVGEDRPPVHRILARIPRDTVALTLSTQLLEQLTWLEQPEDPLPRDVIDVAAENVLLVTASIVFALDAVLRQRCGDDPAAAWTIEALRAAQRARGLDDTCSLSSRFGADTSAALLGLAEAAGRAAVRVERSADELAPHVAAAVGHGVTVYVATDRLRRGLADG